MSLIYSVDRFGIFTTSKSCIDFGPYYVRYSAKYKHLYQTLWTVVPDKYFNTVFRTLGIHRDYFSTLWIQLRMYLPPRQCVPVVLVAALMEYLADVLVHFTVIQSASTRMLLRMEIVKMQMSNRNSKIYKQMVETFNPNVVDHCNQLLDSIHHRLEQTWVVYFDVKIDAPRVVIKCI